jgi:2-dehydro-3-deoxygalactonokinase
MENTASPALLALDWGTSSLRAFLIDGQGTVLHRAASDHGIQNLPLPGVPGFESAFEALCGDWLRRWPNLKVVASGMVGSAQGWKEAPYVDCPTDTAALAAHAIRVDSGLGANILIAPGVLHNPAFAAPDVMRGEEIQIAGALALHPGWAGNACMVLPGTHSKWVRVEGGRIVRFATYMTGELFALLSQHSILARLMPQNATPDEDEADAAFASGVAAARQSGPGDLSHQIFATRTLGLLNRLPAAVLKDYLSGLLIGHELISGLANQRDDAAPLLLIGDPALSQRYSHALAVMGITPSAILPNTAPDGLFRFAIAAGLVARQ